MKREEKSRLISFRINQELLARLKDYARRRGLSVSDAIKEALIKHKEQADSDGVQMASVSGIKSQERFGETTIVSHCAIPDCSNPIKRSKGRGRKSYRFCSEACRERYKAMYNKLYMRYVKAPKKGQSRKTPAWVRKEALKRR